jgi:hypothetical protein
MTISIYRILLVWKVLNRYPPIIDKICMEGPVCIVFMTQILCPRLFPFISNIKLPVLVRLEFKETDTDSGLFKIATHQESWTIQGSIFFYI